MPSSKNKIAPDTSAKQKEREENVYEALINKPRSTHPPLPPRDLLEKPPPVPRDKKPGMFQGSGSMRGGSPSSGSMRGGSPSSGSMRGGSPSSGSMRGRMRGGGRW